jgi:hypothetical protein
MYKVIIIIYFISSNLYSTELKFNPELLFNSEDIVYLKNQIIEFERENINPLKINASLSSDMNSDSLQTNFFIGIKEDMALLAGKFIIDPARLIIIFKAYEDLESLEEKWISTEKQSLYPEDIVSPNLLTPLLAQAISRSLQQALHAHSLTDNKKIILTGYRGGATLAIQVASILALGKELTDTDSKLNFLKNDIEPGQFNLITFHPLKPPLKQHLVAEFDKKVRLENVLHFASSFAEKTSSDSIYSYPGIVLDILIHEQIKRGIKMFCGIMNYFSKDIQKADLELFLPKTIALPSDQTLVTVMRYFIRLYHAAPEVSSPYDGKDIGKTSYWDVRRGPVVKWLYNLL